MERSRVRYFLAVCEHGSFTAAARACGVTKASVTTGVDRLERTLGAKLFERQPVRLTSLGAELRPLFETMQSAADCVHTIIERHIVGPTRSTNDPERAVEALPDEVLAVSPRSDGPAKV